MADPEAGLTLVRAGAVLADLAAGDGPTPDALVLRGGRVHRLGAYAELADAHPAAAVVDLGGRWVVPGLDDAHCHPTIAADELCHVSLPPDQQQDLRAVTAAVARSHRSNGWVKLVGWLEERCDGNPVDRRLLDSLCPTEPLVVVHANGHWGYANTAGLLRMGFVDDAGAVRPEAVPAGGWVDADADGLATGRIYENAMFDIMEPALARDPARTAIAATADRLAALRRIQQDYLRAGVTALTEALCSRTGWDLLEQVAAEGGAPRYSALVSVSDLELARTLQARPQPRLRVSGLKSFVDGALNGGTCLLRDPVPTGEPQQVRDVDDIAAELDRARQLGLTLGVHANGDAAVDIVLSAGERTGSSGRIEHGSVLRDDQLPRIRDQGWAVVPFGSYIRQHGARLADTYGRDRMTSLIRHRTLLAAGVTVAGSSDYPCAGPDPWQGIWSCVTRESADGEVLGAAERLSPAQALWLYTRGSALVRPQPGLAGTLRPGAPADFAVLDVDPREREGLTHQLTAPVAATYVAGEPVHVSAGVDVPS